MFEVFDGAISCGAGCGFLPRALVGVVGYLLGHSTAGWGVSVLLSASGHSPIGVGSFTGELIGCVGSLLGQAPAG